MLYRREDTSEYIWGLISKNSHFTGLVFPGNIIFRFEKCCTSCKRNCIRAVFKTTKERWKRQIALIQVWRALLVIFRNWVPKKRSACDSVLKRSFVKCLLRAADPIPPESPENVPGWLSPHRLEILQSSQSSLCFCSKSRAANSGKGGLREPLWESAEPAAPGTGYPELPQQKLHQKLGWQKPGDTQSVWRYEEKGDKFVEKATHHHLVNKWPD